MLQSLIKMNTWWMNRWEGEKNIDTGIQYRRMDWYAKMICLYASMKNSSHHISWSSWCWSLLLSTSPYLFESILLFGFIRYEKKFPFFFLSCFRLFRNIFSLCLCVYVERFARLTFVLTAWHLINFDDDYGDGQCFPMFGPLTY